MSDELLTVLIALAASAAVIAVQLLFCFKTRRIWLRLIPTVLPLAVVIAMYVHLRLATGWEALGYLILLLGAAVLLAADALGWLIFSICRYVRRVRCKTTDSEE